MRSGWRSRWAWAGCAAAGLLLTPIPAYGAPMPAPGTSDEWMAQVGPDLLRSNSDLADYVTWLDRDRTFTDAGYITGVADVEHRAMRLLWEGASPLQAVAANEATRRGIVFSLEERAYSVADRAAIQRRLTAADRQLRLAGFAADGLDGVGVHEEPLTLLGHRTRVHGAEPALGDIAALASRIAGVRLRVLEVAPPVLLAPF